MCCSATDANQCVNLNKEQLNVQKENSVEINLLTFVILAFASYRITRFFVFDSLIAHSRDKLYVGLANQAHSGPRIKQFLAHKILEGISCTWCLGVYISFATYWLYTWQSPEFWGRTGYLIVAAIAGLQGLLHAYEPGDDD